MALDSDTITGILVFSYSPDIYSYYFYTAENTTEIRVMANTKIVVKCSDKVIGQNLALVKSPYIVSG